MTTRDDKVDILVDSQQISGTLVAPVTAVPGVLFVHGWGGSQQQYIERARAIAALGCVSLAFDLRGHARTQPQREAVTREDNLRDVLAAYDALAHKVDPSAIAVVGSSYGGYLAAILTSLRSVKWLALRAPAIYKDDGWEVPKLKLSKAQDLATYRQTTVRAADNRALRACAAFDGDVLIVESEHDHIVPHPVSSSYLEACMKARSLTYRVIHGADHALSKEPWQRAYTSLLIKWLTEMLFGAREGDLATEPRAQPVPSPQEAPPQRA
jgi:pimeloyl-ACP methyl ester carboxylesterase